MDAPPDTPLQRLAVEVRAAIAKGDSYPAIADRGGAGSWQNVQNVALGTIENSTVFVPICAALGLDPMKMWYDEGGTPFDGPTLRILNIIESWSAEERTALANMLEKRGQAPKRPPKKQHAA